ncbi:MAG: lactoylglutathione lyase [Nitrosomonadales bacterium]|nr:lactoylglutathione lyase [Nitrosomonadales bacterium]MBT3918253.1 lactoylglutathione lyase [Nitrosomonadales bacterium]MBT5572739.1 lactoylglutathione lyase [Nitrosomonadales bacterium]MBT6014394.1 lactoylglutathione lyase [Nitrosomonadales bacterium]MBT6602875.1 lactoylglutathione lyase [Nitrosomonadales bacterium]
MRILHSMIRVINLEESIQFYTEILGMHLLREKEYPKGKFSLAFLGYGKESEETAIELTYNWDTSEYEHGNAFGHIAIEVDDIYKTCEAIKNKGAKIIRDPGPMMGSKLLLAFIEDPNGYKIELIEKGTF